MATEREVFEQARRGVMQAAAPWVGMSSDRVAMQADKLDRERKLADDQRRRDEARQDWMERFSMQAAAAKEAAKESRDHASSERVARQNWQAAENDWQWYRGRMAQLADRGWAVEQDEKEMRLNAAQIGLVGATNPKMPIEEVYKYLYDNAPEELEKAKKRQRDAFAKLNPKIHETYNVRAEQRANIYKEIGQLIQKHANGPEEDAIIEALIPKLRVEWRLSDEQVESLRAGGLGRLAQIIGDDEKRRMDVERWMGQVAEELKDRNAVTYSDKLRQLMSQESIIKADMERIQGLNAGVGLEDPEAATNQFKKVVVDGVGNNAMNNRFSDLPTNTGTPAANTPVAPTPTPEAVPVPTPTATPASQGTPAPFVPPRSSPADPDSPEAGGYGSGAAPSAGYNFMPPTGDLGELQAEREDLTARLERQGDLRDRMIRFGGAAANLSGVEDSMKKHHVRLNDIENMIFRVNQTNIKPTPLEGGDPGYSGAVSGNFPLRPLSAVEQAERSILGETWVDPRTLSQEERERLRGESTIQKF